MNNTFLEASNTVVWRTGQREFCYNENDLHSIKIFGAWKWNLLDLITELSSS